MHTFLIDHYTKRYLKQLEKSLYCSKTIDSLSLLISALLEKTGITL